MTKAEKAEEKKAEKETVKETKVKRGSVFAVYQGDMPVFSSSNEDDAKAVCSAMRVKMIGQGVDVNDFEHSCCVEPVKVINGVAELNTERVARRRKVYDDSFRDVNGRRETLTERNLRLAGNPDRETEAERDTRLGTHSTLGTAEERRANLDL